MPRFERLSERPFRPTYVFGVGLLFGLVSAGFFWWHRQSFGGRPVTVTDALYERALSFLVAANDGGQPGARTGDGAYVPMVARGD